MTLRTANTANPAWRVLHRVTYVNRIPPGADNIPRQVLAPPVTRIVDLNNNELLVDLVLAALRGAPGAAQLGDAVMAVMNPPGSAGNYPPAELGAIVPWWDAFLNTTRGAGADPDRVQLLQQLQLDVLRYLQAGFADGTLKR